MSHQTVFPIQELPSEDVLVVRPQARELTF